MIEYITQTGIFGIFWLFTFIIFIGSLIKFIKTNGILQTLITIFPIIISLVLFNFLADELMGKSDFDATLIFIKDTWFIVGHIFILTILVIKNEDCLKFWRYKKDKRGGKR